jgi:hypothetical protein
MSHKKQKARNPGGVAGDLLALIPKPQGASAVYDDATQQLEDGTSAHHAR